MGKWWILGAAFIIMLQLRCLPQIPEMPDGSVHGMVVERKTTAAIVSLQDQQVLLYSKQPLALEDEITANVTCSRVKGNRNFHLFDYPAYMKRRGIYAQCEASSVTIVKQGNDPRSRLWHRTEQMEEPDRSWVQLMLYGIQPEQEQLSYMVTSSGMHLSFLANLLVSCLSLWMSSSMAGVCALGVISFLGSITTYRDALIRVLFFRLVSSLFPSMSAHDRLGIGMLALLCFKPYLASEITFVLPVFLRLAFLFNIRKHHAKLLSLLVLIPIQFYYFHQIDLIQILLFSLQRVLYGISYCLALVYVALPWDGWYALAQWLSKLASIGSHSAFPIYYQASLMFVLVWFSVLLQYLGGNRRKDALRLWMLLGYTQISPYLQPYMEVVMIDVGQGDCTLITLPFHQGAILIDVAGAKERDIAADIIVPFLHAKGVHSLDLVILTHDDLDHSGGLASLQEQIPVKQLVRTKEQSSISFGNFTLQFLLQDQTFDDANDNSIITYMEAFQSRLLFMGDAGIEVEQALMHMYPRLRADVVKVGHHGSKYSSSLPFMHQIHPVLALISCGADNRYGHPAKETMDTLAKEEIAAITTPQSGAVSIKFTNLFRFYKTATNEFGIILIGDQ